MKIVRFLNGIWADIRDAGYVTFLGNVSENY